MRDQLDLTFTFVEWNPIYGLELSAGDGCEAQSVWIHPKYVPELVEWLAVVTTRSPPPETTND